MRWTNSISKGPARRSSPDSVTVTSVAEVELEPLEWPLSRLIGAEDAAAVRSFVWGEVLEDSVGRNLAVFRSEFELERFARDHPEIELDRFIAGG